MSSKKNDAQNKPSLPQHREKGLPVIDTSECWACALLTDMCQQESLAKNHDQAIVHCTQSIHSGLLYGYDLAVAYTHRAIAYSNRQNYVDAILDYNQAISVYRDFPVAFYNRGVAYHKNKEYSRAIANYTEALRLDVGLAPAYLNRGVIYSDSKEYDLAIEKVTLGVNLYC